MTKTNHIFGPYYSESLADDRRRATEGIPFDMPEWDAGSLQTFCSYHVRYFESELDYWQDKKWKTFVTDRYHACCAWILAS